MPCYDQRTESAANSENDAPLFSPCLKVRGGSACLIQDNAIAHTKKNEIISSQHSTALAQDLSGC